MIAKVRRQLIALTMETPDRFVVIQPDAPTPESCSAVPPGFKMMASDIKNLRLPKRNASTEIKLHKPQQVRNLPVYKLHRTKRAKRMNKRQSVCSN